MKQIIDRIFCKGCGEELAKGVSHSCKKSRKYAKNIRSNPFVITKWQVKRVK